MNRINVFFNLLIAIAIAIALFLTVKFVDYGLFIDSNPYFIYLLISLFFILILFFCSRLESEKKAGALTVIVSLIFSVYLIEVFLFMYNPLPWHRGLFVDGYDIRTPLEVVHDYRESGIDAYPTIAPLAFAKNIITTKSGNQVIALSGVSNVKTIYCNEGDGYMEYMSDDYGFNNENNIWDSDIDIALIGDSFAQGACLPTNENIAVTISKLSGKKVLNLGIGSSGPLVELAILKEYLSVVKPKTVLWMYTEFNDLAGNIQAEEKYTSLTNYLKFNYKNGNYYFQKDIDNIVKKHINKWYEKNLTKLSLPKDKRWFESTLSIIKLLHVRNILGIGKLQQNLDEMIGEKLTMFLNVIKEAKRSVEEWDGELVFVYLTDWTRYNHKVNNSTYRFKDKLINNIEDLGIKVVDVHEVLSMHNDSLSLFPLRINGHYTQEGYDIVSQQIFDELY